MDADLQDDPAEIPRFLEALDGGSDLVSGWKRERQDPLSKRLPSRFFNWMTGLATGVHSATTTAASRRRDGRSTSRFRCTANCTGMCLRWPSISATG